MVTLRVLAKQGGVQSIIAEDGSAVLKMAEGETLPQDLANVVPRGVQSGHTLMRVDLDGGWEERLRNTLELLVAAQNEKEPVEA